MYVLRHICIESGFDSRPARNRNHRAGDGAVRRKRQYMGLARLVLPLTGGVRQVSFRVVGWIGRVATGCDQMRMANVRSIRTPANK